MVNRSLFCFCLLWSLLPGVAAAMDIGTVGRTYTYQMRTNDDKLFCIDIRGGKAKPGSVVQLYKCHGATNAKLNQRWLITGLHEMVGEGGICLDSYDQGGSRGGRLKMQLCNGTQFQKWSFEALPIQKDSSRPRLLIKNTKGLCIGVQGGRMADNTPLVLTDCKHAGWVTWTQIRELSVYSAACAKKVRKLNDKYLKDVGGANDYDAEKTCDMYGNDVYKVFKIYVERTLDVKRTHVLEAARRELHLK